VSELLHDLWEVAPWMPTQTLGLGSYDSDSIDAGLSPNYLMPLALLSHTTFWTDFTKLDAAQRRQTAWWIRWYRAHRDGVGPMVYELTGSDPLSGKDWLVLQPWHGTSGYVFAFRQATTAAMVRVELQGVNPVTSYLLTDVRTGQVVEQATGAELRRGVSIRSPEKFSARVLQVSPQVYCGDGVPRDRPGRAVPATAPSAARPRAPSTRC
jgi:hypothetical protein